MTGAGEDQMLLLLLSLMLVIRCGVLGNVTRIVGGQEAEVGEYPWQVGLVYRGEPTTNWLEAATYWLYDITNWLLILTTF